MAGGESFVQCAELRTALTLLAIRENLRCLRIPQQQKGGFNPPLTVRSGESATVHRCAGTAGRDGPAPDRHATAAGLPKAPVSIVGFRRRRDAVRDRLCSGGDWHAMSAGKRAVKPNGASWQVRDRWERQRQDRDRSTPRQALGRRQCRLHARSPRSRRCHSPAQESRLRQWGRSLAVFMALDVDADGKRWPLVWAASFTLG